MAVYDSQQENSAASNTPPPEVDFWKFNHCHLLRILEMNGSWCTVQLHSS